MNHLPPRNTYHQFCNFMNECYIKIRNNGDRYFDERYMVLPAVIYALHHCPIDGKSKVYKRVFKRFKENLRDIELTLDFDEYLESEFDYFEDFKEMKKLFLELSEFALNEEASFSDIENRFSKRTGRYCEGYLDMFNREYLIWFTIEL